MTHLHEALNDPDTAEVPTDAKHNEAESDFGEEGRTSVSMVTFNDGGTCKYILNHMTCGTQYLQQHAVTNTDILNVYKVV